MATILAGPQKMLNMPKPSRGLTSRRLSVIPLSEEKPMQMLKLESKPSKSLTQPTQPRSAPTLRLFRLTLRMAPACLALLILTGCANTMLVAPKLNVTLPETPIFMAPIPEPPLTAGQDARVLLAQDRGALKLANSRLSASRDWYNIIRNNYNKVKLK